MNYLRLDPVYGNGYQDEDGYFVAATEPFEAVGATWAPAPK